MSSDLVRDVVELIKEVSTELPADVTKSIKAAKNREKKGSIPFYILDTVVKNINLAKRGSLPLCQDTGNLNFYIYYDSRKHNQKKIRDSIIKAVKITTKKNYLRPNAVDSITGTNSGNVGARMPAIRFNEWSKNYLKIDLMLKGGGSENVSAQYKLPDVRLKAGRNLDGVKRCVIDAVKNAGGKGCAPGIIGVCIGGDRALGYEEAKKQLFRKVNDKNKIPRLAKLEKELYQELNKLNIGPMGLGGKTTALGVKVTPLHRVPASFFVSIAYMCWACRRKSLIIK